MDSLRSLIEKQVEAGNINAKTLALGSVFAVSLIGAIAYASGSLSGDDSNLAPALTEEEARDIMKEILTKFKVVATQMMGAAENVKQQIAQAGQEMDDAQVLKNIILPHLVKGFSKVQQDVLDANDVDEDELEDAVTTYCKQGDEQLNEISNKIRQIYQQFGGDLGPTEGALTSAAGGGGAPKIPMEELLVIMRDLKDKILENTKEYALGFIDEHGAPQSMPMMQRFQEGLLKLTEKAESELLQANELTQSDFQQLIMLNQESREVQEIFMAMQLENKIQLNALGITMM